MKAVFYRVVCLLRLAHDCFALVRINISVFVVVEQNSMKYD